MSKPLPPWIPPWLDPRGWLVRRRVRTPTLLQMQQAECGAACLGIILAYFGRHEPLEKLRHACGVSRDGAKASNVLRVARSYGLIAKGFAVYAPEVRKLPLPFVAFWNFTHFVVVEGFGRGKVYLNDPAWGPRVVDASRFEEAYSGVLLAFQPGSRFVRTSKPPGPIASLVQRTRGSAGSFAFIGLASLALFVPGLLMPAFSRLYVDYYLIQGQQSWLWPLLVAMAATGLVTAILSWLLEGGLLRFQTKLRTTWSSQMVWHVLRLPLDYFAQRSAGDLSSRVFYNNTLARLVADRLATTLLALTTLAIYAAIMLQYDVGLTLIGIGFAAINMVAFLKVARQLRDTNEQLQRDKGKSVGLLMQSLRSIDTYQASGTESVVYNQWTGQQAKIGNAMQSAGRAHALLTAVPPLLGLLGTTVILLVGGLRIMNGSLTIGMLVAFQGLMVAFSMPVRQLVEAGAQLQEAQGLLNRLDDVMRQEVDPEFLRRSSATVLISDGATQAMPRKLGGRLELRGITFGYSPLEPPLIDGFDLQLEAGASVAIVGASGSGKSTVGRIIAGVTEPWSGQILVDGRPLVSIPRDVFRETLAVVDQDVALFEGTVAENLTMWDSSLPEARMVEAAKDACLHTDIAARPAGYHYVMEPGGRNFSGGERQRLEIARALIGRPNILLLDEATSALDAKTESQVIVNLRRRGCTCIFIAHRLSAIRDCDEILVLDRGRIVERGSHDQLMTAQGLYRDLLET
ncbi:MAG: NHLP family bacteriocin export ABC transporter peptidase/permease/ATPase subunit [Acidobacteriota bacterium]